jgi:hypothetical protein
MLERLFKDEEMRSPRTSDKMLEPIGMARDCRFGMKQPAEIRSVKMKAHQAESNLIDKDTVEPNIGVKYKRTKEPPKQYG